MKTLRSLCFLFSLLCLFTGASFSQKTKPRPTGAKPTSTPVKKAASPAEQFFNDGLKCDTKDYDCQVSNYTKAINLGLATKAVYQQRASAFTARGDFEKAVADLSKIIELDPNNVEGYKLRAAAYSSVSGVGGIDMAIRDLTSAIDLEPKDADTLQQRGALFLRKKDIDRAVADISKAISIDPNNGDAYVSRAEIFVKSKKHDKAIEDFSKALSLRPENAKALEGRGMSYLELKNFDSAIADFTKCIAVDPRREKPYGYRYSAMYQKNGKFDPQSENDLQQYYKLSIENNSRIIESDKTNSEAYMNRGAAYSATKEYDKAIEDLTKAIDLDASNEMLYMYRASALNAKGNTAQYASDLARYYALVIPKTTKEIELNPQDTSAYLSRGMAYAAQNNYAAAIADYTKIITLDPENATAYAMRAGARLQLNDREGMKQDTAMYEAIKTKKATKRIESEPNNIQSYLDRASSYSSAGNYQKAVEDYSKAIGIDPNCRECYTSRARQYGWLKDYAKAEADYDKAISLEPGVAERYWDRAQHFTDISSTSSRGNFYPKAIQDMSKAIELAPKSVKYVWRRGSYYDVLDDHKNAITDYTNAIDLFSVSKSSADESWFVSSIEGLALIFYKMKDEIQAIATMSKGIELLPNSARAYWHRGQFYRIYVKDYAKAQADFVAGGQAGTDSVWQKANRDALADMNAGMAKDAADAARRAAEAKERKQKQKTETINALLGIAGAAVDAIAQSKGNSSSQTPSISTRQTSTPSTTNPSSGNASSGAKGGNQRLKKGEILIADGEAEGQKEKPSDFSSIPTDCMVQGTAQYKHPWSSWQPTPVNGLQWRLQGPIRACGNPINDEKGKVVYSWYFAYKNTTNNILLVDCQQISGDGTEVNTCGGLIAPGGVIKHTDAANHTFSDSQNVSFKLRYLETCTAVRISKETPYGTATGWGCQ
ncbi:MAG: tetratricopeptide repeat protein [Pyrinomonadaceae bacterium]